MVAVTAPVYRLQESDTGRSKRSLRHGHILPFPLLLSSRGDQWHRYVNIWLRLGESVDLPMLAREWIQFCKYVPVLSVVVVVVVVEEEGRMKRRGKGRICPCRSDRLLLPVSLS